MKRYLDFSILVIAAAALLVGCTEKDYGFIGDPGLVPGFPITGGAGGAGGGVQYTPSIPPDGDLSFVLEWTPAGGGPAQDLDIYVVEPSGDALGFSETFGYGPTPSGGIVDHDDTGGGVTGGPERAMWPIGTPPSGTYEYGFWWYSGGGLAQWTIVVYIGTTPVQTMTGSTGMSAGRIIVGTVTY